MKTLEEKIEVMQACLDGKTIEIFEDDIWNDWKANRQFPDFNWSDFDYRIKPENKQVPFDSEDFERILNKKIKHKLHKFVGILTMVEGSTIVIGDKRFDIKFSSPHLEWYNDLLNRWESCTKTVKE